MGGLFQKEDNKWLYRVVPPIRGRIVLGINLPMFHLLRPAHTWADCSGGEVYEEWLPVSRPYVGGLFYHSWFRQMPGYVPPIHGRIVLPSESQHRDP